jgi:hypothetical protein
MNQGVFETGLGKRLEEVLAQNLTGWRERTNWIKHVIGQWGRNAGFRVHYKIERDAKGTLAATATSESPYQLDLAWSTEPVEIYDHAEMARTFDETYAMYGGVTLAMECEWAQYGVSHSRDLRLRSMIKDFRKLTWINSRYKVFVYCSMYPGEEGTDGSVQTFIAARVLAHVMPNGEYYTIEHLLESGHSAFRLYRYTGNQGRFTVLADIR